MGAGKGRRKSPMLMGKAVERAFGGGQDAENDEDPPILTNWPQARALSPCLVAVLDGALAPLWRDSNSIAFPEDT